MKFKRVQLISLIEVEINRREEAAREKYRKAKEDRQEAVNSWLHNYAVDWRKFAESILKAMEFNLPVDRAMAPEAITGYNSQLLWFDKAEPEEPDPHLGDLPAVLKMLKAATDEEVTVSELQRIGFRIPSIFG